MDLEHKNKGHYPSSHSSGSRSGLVQPNQPSKLSNLFDRAHTPMTLIFISSILEIILGAGVVFAAVAGFLEPMWFSNFITLIGSLACVVGIFLLYSIVHRDSGREQLLRDATRRIMNAQN